MLYDEKCPLCGTVNKGLDLEETNGWFECEKCLNTVNTFRIKQPMVQVPLIRMGQKLKTNP